MDPSSFLPSLLLSSTALASLSIGILAFSVSRYKGIYSLFYFLPIASAYFFIKALNFCLGAIKVVINLQNISNQMVTIWMNTVMNDMLQGIGILLVSAILIPIIELIKFYQSKNSIKLDLLNLIKRMKNILK